MNPRMQVNRVRVHVQRLLTQPVTELSRFQRSVRYMADLARHCTRELVHDRAGTMAAALTFHTMFSLLPTLALMLVVLQAFVTDTQLEQLKESTVSYVLQWMDAAETAADQAKEALDGNDSEPEPADAAERAGSALGSLVGGIMGLVRPPDEADSAAEDIASAVARREAAQQAAVNVRANIQKWLDELENISFSRIGIVGILLFIYAATNLLGTIESSFNRIYDAPAGRRWYIRFPMYYTLITLGPLVIIGGQWIQGQLLDRLDGETPAPRTEQVESPGAAADPAPDAPPATDEQTTDAEDADQPVQPLTAVGRFFAGVLSFLSPVITTWLVLLALYMLLPTTRVRLRAAAIGALVSALGWVALIELFGLYVSNAAATTLYGALALLPLFLMWLWITWLLILFGLELSYALQHLRTGRFKSLKGLAEEDVLVDPRWIVPLMALVGERFGEGKTISDDELSARLSLPVRAVRHLTRALQTEHLLHQTARGESDEETRWTMARPPERVTLASLLQMGDELSLERRANPSLPGVKTLEDLRRRQLQAADGKTLAQLIAPQPDPAPQP